MLHHRSLSPNKGKNAPQVYEQLMKDFFTAVGRNDYTSMEALVKINNDLIRTRDDQGCTAIFSAVSNDKVGSLRLLVGMKADVNVQNDVGDTPLHVACRSGFKEVAACLIQAHAKWDILNDYDETCLDQGLYMKSYIEELTERYMFDLEQRRFWHYEFHEVTAEQERTAAKKKLHKNEAVSSKKLGVAPVTSFGHHSPLPIYPRTVHTPEILTRPNSVHARKKEALRVKFNTSMAQMPRGWRPGKTLPDMYLHVRGQQANSKPLGELVDGYNPKNKRFKKRPSVQRRKETVKRLGSPAVKRRIRPAKVKDVVPVVSTKTFREASMRSLQTFLHANGQTPELERTCLPRTTSVGLTKKGRIKRRTNMALKPKGVKQTMLPTDSLGNLLSGLPMSVQARIWNHSSIV